MFDLKFFCLIPIIPIAIIILIYRANKIQSHNKTVDELNECKTVLSQILNEQKNKEQETNKNKNKNDPR